MMMVQGIKYMTDFEAKKAILDIGRRMYEKGFVASNDGNISCKVGPDTIWTTPTGVSKGYMTQDMLVKMNLSGKVLMGKNKPSSEVKMHLRVYKENPDVQAVTHAHPPVATSFAIAGIPLDKAVLTEAVMGLGTIPVADYATPGTEEVPDSIAPYVNTYNGVLLANHGALTWGKDVYQAYYRLESVEYYATVLMYTGNVIGRQNQLTGGQISRLLDIRRNLGITTGGIPKTSDTEAAPFSVPAVEARPEPSKSQAALKGVTPLVSPGMEPPRRQPVGGQVMDGGIDLANKLPVQQPSGRNADGRPWMDPDKAPSVRLEASDKSREELIKEVVRRVLEQLS